MISINHDRKHGDYRVEPLGALLDRASGFDRVALRQFFRQLGDRRRQLPINRLGLDAGHDIRLDGDRRQQIAPPDHWRLQLVLDARDLAISVAVYHSQWPTCSPEPDGYGNMSST
jgi:hypothetical protein